VPRLPHRQALTMERWNRYSAYTATARSSPRCASSRSLGSTGRAFAADPPPPKRRVRTRAPARVGERPRTAKTARGTRAVEASARRGEEVRARLFVAGCHGAEALEGMEAVLDPVAKPSSSPLSIFQIPVLCGPFRQRNERASAGPGTTVTHWSRRIGPPAHPQHLPFPHERLATRPRPWQHPST
jgi:hypothetical protein